MTVKGTRTHDGMLDVCTSRFLKQFERQHKFKDMVERVMDANKQSVYLLPYDGVFVCCVSHMIVTC